MVNRKPRKWNIELIRELVANLGFTLINDEYINKHIKLILIDKDGYHYSVLLDNIKSNHIPSKFHKSNPFTIQNIKIWLKLNNKELQLISQKYEDSKKKLLWKCLRCKEEFDMTWDAISALRCCPYCSGYRVGKVNCLAIKRPDLAKEWHPTKNGELTPYNITVNSDKKIWWKCNKNPKHIWETAIHNRNCGKGCPYCSGKYSSEDYNLLVINPELCEEWDYERNNKSPKDYTPNSGVKVSWKCKKCSNQWLAIIYSRNIGMGCPQCSESKGEKTIRKYLEQNNMFFKTQYEFLDLKGIGNGFLKFDFAVFKNHEKTKLKLLIEYDGVFHFEKQYDDDGYETIQHHDKLKNKYCEQNEISLLRIPYWEFDNIEKILALEIN